MPDRLSAKRGIGACAFGLALVICGACRAAPDADCLDRNREPEIGNGGVGVQALLKNIAIDTKWAELPAATRARLREIADERLAAFRARWARGGLARKEAILLGCPTPEMTAAIDDFYRKGFGEYVAADFALAQLKSAAFARALVRNYLGTIAAKRAALTYLVGAFPNRDWDGRSLFDSVRLPDRQALADIKQYNASVVRELRGFDRAALGEGEKHLWERVLFEARAQSVGAFSGDSFGGGDLESPCGILALNNDVLRGYVADGGRPRIFASDDEVLREINAIYLHGTALKWLDVGTFNAAISLALCNTPDDDVNRFVGDPGRDAVAKGILLLKHWWIERVAASPEARRRCTVYSAADRRDIWEAFSANQLFNNDGSSSLRTFRGKLDAYRDARISYYRAIASRALDRVFPDDTILAPAQRQRVRAALAGETAFGLLPATIAQALDGAQATTGGTAATAWNAAIAANVGTIGGDYADGAPVRAADAAAIDAMYRELASWLIARYRGYPIALAPLLRTLRVTATTDSNSGSDIATGDVRIGVGTRRSKLEYFSLILHELRHAVNYAWSANAPEGAKVESDRGPAMEGAAVAAEALLLEPFARQALGGELAYLLNALDYGRRDARMIGTTEATLARFFRAGCSAADAPDTLDFTRGIAARYGLAPEVADAAARRAHVGTQYLQYISGGLQMLDDIADLQRRIDPAGRRTVDPFVLFACGLNNPRRDEAYVDALRACMKR
jgi:hypothetical protein